MIVIFTTEDTEAASQHERGHRVIFSKCILKTIVLGPLLFLCVLCGFSFSGCGRKGPPLPPLVRLPGTIVDLNARRFGDEMVLQFTVPQANTDGSRPADLDRIEVYAHTGPLPAAADFLKYGALIGNVAVRSPVPGAGGSTAPGVELGTRTSVSEKVTNAEMEIGRMPVVRTSNQRQTAPVVEPVYETPDTVNAPIPTMRYYTAVGVSHRNRRGTFSTPLAVPRTRRG